MDDDSMLELLHRDHAVAVRSYVRRRIGPDDADDVVADVFVVAWRRIDDLPAEPRTWLLGIARKTLGNRRRTARRQRALLERLADEAGTGVPTAAAATGTDGASDGTVLRALASLSPADREVLLLVTWDGLSTAEAGQVLGARPGTVAQRVHRARGRLERALERAGPSPVENPHRDASVATPRASAPDRRPASTSDRPRTGTPT
jgi:RNA polymerase sigma factor (sigma-70 family)